MNSIKTAVCDDDMIMIDMISQCVKNIGAENGFTMEVTEFVNPKELLAHVDSDGFDVLFLDVEMPEIDGLELAGLIREKLEGALIVFVTQLDNIVYEVFPYKPFDFVRKSQLEKGMKRVFVMLKDIFNTESIEIEYWDCDVKKSVSSDRIVWVAGGGNYPDMWDIEGKKHSVRITLKNLNQMLEPYGFIQVHRKYLINKKYWEGFSKNKVAMRGQINLEVGRAFVKRVREEYAEKIRR